MKHAKPKALVPEDTQTVAASYREAARASGDQWTWMLEARDVEGLWALWCLNSEKALGAPHTGSELPYRGRQPVAKWVAAEAPQTHPDWGGQPREAAAVLGLARRLRALTQKRKANREDTEAVNLRAILFRLMEERGASP